jgi:Archaeal fructose-1,6-bisphosphatase and related enzymes of inositol monophosphatase family
MPSERVLESRQLIIDTFKSFRSKLLDSYGVFEFERKDNFSPVTECDEEIEVVLKAKLAEEFPELGFKGEETGQDGEMDSYWIVDPIDGTSSFIRGMPNCTNMAAYVDGDDVICSVIYDFVNDILYTAIKGGGAFRDGKQIFVNDYNRKFEVNMHGREVFSRISNLFMSQDLRPHQPIGAIGRALVLLSEGQMDGWLQLSGYGKEYDFAPGVLLATEAGAKIVVLDDIEKPFSIHEVYRDFFIGTEATANLISQNIDEIRSIRKKAI